MSIAGNWVLHFSWGCSSSYAQATMTLNGNGTFSGPGTGQWRQRDGSMMLSFDTRPAKYGGPGDGGGGNGGRSRSAGLNGCWSLVRQGTTGLEADAEAAQSFDAAGNAA